MIYKGCVWFLQVVAEVVGDLRHRLTAVCGTGDRREIAADSSFCQRVSRPEQLATLCE